MHFGTRRAIAALTSAAAVAAGAVGTLGAGTAAAAGLGNGLIAFQGTNGSVQVVHANGTGLRTLSALPVWGDGPLSWSFNGSRIAEGGYGSVTSVRADGGDRTQVTSGTSVSTQSGVYDGSGGWLTSAANGQIYEQTSDGWNWVTRVMGTAQEPASVCDSQPALNAFGVFAFTRRDCNGDNATSVWTYDQHTHVLHRVAAGGASAPVFSADGKAILYTVPVGGTTQIAVASTSGAGTSRVLTHDAHGASSPSLSPDGTMLAYQSTDPTQGSVVKVLNLATGTTTVLADGTSPVWQPLRTVGLDRVYGTGRIANDDAVSRWDFNSVTGPAKPGLLTAWNAVLVDKNDPTDAAPAVALAAEKQAPLLYTSGSSLDPNTAAELRRVLHRGWTVYLEGNTSELSNHVAAQVQALGLHVVRIGASGSSAESVATARAITATPSWIIVADSQDYREAAAAASAVGAGGYKGRIVLLLNSTWNLPPVLANYLNGLNPTRQGVTVVGSRSVYAMEHTRLLRQMWRFWTVSGSDPEWVSAALASYWYGGNVEVTVGSSADWRSAMAGAAGTAPFGPLVWTSSTRLDAVDSAYLQKESASVWNVQTFGGGYTNATLAGIDNSVGAAPSWVVTRWDANGVLSAEVALPQAAAALGSGPLVAGPVAEGPGQSPLTRAQTQG